MKLIEKIKPYIELEICGYNLERTLNFLCCHSIEFYVVNKKDIKNASIQIKLKDKDYVCKILQEKNIEIKNEKYCGLLKAVNFYKLRWGLVVGAIIFIASLIVLTNFMFKIEVVGTENVKSEEVVSFLNSKGIKQFTHLNSISTDEVEKIILENFQEVSMVSAIKKGCCLIVNIKEKLLNNEYENTGSFTPLLATQNGIIKEITIIQGTPLVKVGDIVKVGDKLVAPYVVDSNGKQISIEPKAKISAEVWLNGQSEHAESRAIKERTGNVLKFRETSINDVVIFSTVQSKVDFKNYECEEKVSYLSETLLPIKYKEIFYFETKCVIIEEEFEKVKDAKILEAKNNALSQVKNKKIIAENYSISKKNDKTIVNYVITVEDDICT